MNGLSGIPPKLLNARVARSPGVNSVTLPPLVGVVEQGLPSEDGSYCDGGDPVEIQPMSGLLPTDGR